MVLGDDRPAVGQLANLAASGVQHRLDGEDHAGLQLGTGAGTPVVQHLGIFMEVAADAVAAELAHDGKALFLGIGLDDVADVAQACAGSHLLDAQPQALPGDIHQTLGQHRRLADHEHAAGVAVEAILDDRDIDVEDVAVLELAVTGDAVADLVVDRRTDRLGVGRMARRGVIERRGDRALHVGHVGVAETVQLLGGGARHHEGGDVVQKLGRQSAGNTHFLDFFRGLDSDGHGGGQGGIRTAW